MFRANDGWLRSVTSAMTNEPTPRTRRAAIAALVLAIGLALGFAGYHALRAADLAGALVVHGDHGSPSIPGHPASPACARLHDEAMDLRWDDDLVPVGAPVWVH